MGLSIIAGENISEILSENGFMIYNSDFPQSNMNFNENSFYIFKGKTIDFSAGSYSNYGRFRRDLCLLVNNIPVEELWNNNDDTLPFYWLLNFSDCDGYIGTDYCKILLQDFEKYSKIVHSNLENYFINLFDNFHEAFKLASNNGIVKFS